MSCSARDSITRTISGYTFTMDAKEGDGLTAAWLNRKDVTMFTAGDKVRNIHTNKEYTVKKVEQVTSDGYLKKAITVVTLSDGTKWNEKSIIHFVKV